MRNGELFKVENPRVSLKNACQCKFLRHFTRKELLPCLAKSGGGVGACVLLFFLNILLIMEASYALNGLIYNMSTGCLFTERHCNQTLRFYAQGPLGHLMGWATLLSLAELFILLVMLGMGHCITSYCKARYDAYKLAMVNSLPYVIDGESEEIELSSADYSL